MNSLQSTTVVVLRRLLADQPVTPAKIAFAWQVAAGALLARAGTPRWHEDGTLRIRARDAHWRRELRQTRPMILQRLTDLLGPGVVRRIIIHGADDELAR